MKKHLLAISLLSASTLLMGCLESQTQREGLEFEVKMEMVSNLELSCREEKALYGPHCIAYHDYFEKSFLTEVPKELNQDETIDHLKDKLHLNSDQVRELRKAAMNYDRSIISIEQKIEAASAYHKENRKETP